MGRLGRLLAAVVCSLLLAGCDGDDGGTGSAPAVEFRRVVTSSHLDGGCRAGAAVCDAWADFACPGDAQRLDDDVLMVCGEGDEAEQPYLLGPAEIVGGVESAEARDREGAEQWDVQVRLDPEAADAFADLTTDLVPHSAQLAIVLDDTVISAPAVQTVVTNGVVRLAGDYTEAEAEALADRLAP